MKNKELLTISFDLMNENGEQITYSFTANQGSIDKMTKKLWQNEHLPLYTTVVKISVRLMKNYLNKFLQGDFTLKRQPIDNQQLTK
jgi:hypothetical protein